MRRVLKLCYAHQCVCSWGSSHMQQFVQKGTNPEPAALCQTADIYPQQWGWHHDRAQFPAAVRAIVPVTSKAWPRQILRKRVQIYKSQTAGSAWDNSLRLGQMVLQLVAAVQLSRNCATKWKICRRRSADWAASEMKGKQLNGSFPSNCSFKGSNFQL